MKKVLAILLSFTLAFSLLAGCSGSKDEPTTAGGGAGDESSASSTVNIEFWHSMGSATGELVQEIVDEFNASQDEVHVECIYQGDYTTAGTKLQAAVANGSTPHVVQSELTRIGMYASQDQLLDLMPYAENDADFDLNALYPGIMDYSYYEGQLISLPNGRSVPVMYYNADMLKEAGCDVPETWEELREVSKALTKDGVYGYGAPLGDSWYYLTLMLTAGGQIYNDEGNNIGFHNESGTKPLQLWLDMIEDGSLYIPDGDDYASNSAMRNAYVPGGSNLIAFGGKSEEENQATWKFLKYMCSGDVAGKYAAGTGYVPTSDAALNSAVYQEMLAKYPYLDAAVGQLDSFVEMPFDEAYTEIKDNVVGKYVQECIIGGMSAQEAVDHMYEEAGKFYK